MRHVRLIHRKIAMRAFLCDSMHSIHISSCYVTGGAVCMIYDGPVEMMACSSPCLDRMGFVRSGESKKMEGVLGFKGRCSVRFSVSHVVGFSVINVCTRLLCSAPLTRCALIRNSL